MLKRVFEIISIVGMIAIIITAFTIPKNPYEIIPSFTMIGFDKPLWLCIIVGGGFLYLMIIFAIYDKLKNKY